MFYLFTHTHTRVLGSVPGRASELSSRCLCLSFDRLGLLLCGGGSGLDAQGAARPAPPPALLHPSINPPLVSGHTLSPCVSCWCQSVAAASVLFRGSISCFGEGVLSDGYGGSGLWAKWSAATCLSVFLQGCFSSVHGLSTCMSDVLFSDHDLSICLPPIHCLSIFLSICRWVCLSTVHCLSMCLSGCLLSVQCLSVVLGSKKVLSSNRWSLCLASIHCLSACSTSVVLRLSSAQYLSASAGWSNTASVSEFWQKEPEENTEPQPYLQQNEQCSGSQWLYLSG